MKVDRIFQEPPRLDRQAPRGTPLHRYPEDVGRERTTQRRWLPQHTVLVIDDEADVFRHIHDLHDVLVTQSALGFDLDVVLIAQTAAHGL